MSRSAFSFHFISPEEVRNFIQQTGFVNVEVIQPSIYFNPNTEQLDAKEHLGDLVWMIDASL